MFSVATLREQRPKFGECCLAHQQQMFDSIFLAFFFKEEDKTAVHCSADVLVSLSKYVAQGGRGQATNKNYRSFPKVIWICHHLAGQGQQSDVMVYKVKYKLVANVSSDAALTRVSADRCCLKQMHETLRLHHFPGS